MLKFCTLNFTVLTFQSNDGKLVACGSKQGVVTVFDTASGKTLHTIEGTLLFGGLTPQHMQ